VEGVADLVAGVTGSSFQLGNFLGPVTAGLVVSYTETYHDAIMFIVIIFLVQAAVELRGVIGIKW
jgi:predicted MFS family arabinose efflux permease